MFCIVWRDATHPQPLLLPASPLDFLGLPSLRWAGWLHLLPDLCGNLPCPLLSSIWALRHSHKSELSTNRRRSPLTLQDPCPPPPKQKVGALPPPDSKGPLLKLAKPTLFINGEFDAVCPAADLKVLAQDMAEVDMRAVVLPVRSSAVKPVVAWCGPSKSGGGTAGEEQCCKAFGGVVWPQ